MQPKSAKEAASAVVSNPFGRLVGSETDMLYTTHPHNLDVLFYTILQNSPLRASKPEEADAILVPFWLNKFIKLDQELEKPNRYSDSMLFFMGKANIMLQLIFARLFESAWFYAIRCLAVWWTVFSEIADGRLARPYSENWDLIPLIPFQSLHFWLCNPKIISEYLPYSTGCRFRPHTCNSCCVPCRHDLAYGNFWSEVNSHLPFLGQKPHILIVPGQVSSTALAAVISVVAMSMRSMTMQSIWTL